MTAEYAELYGPLLDWVYARSGENALGEVDLKEFAKERGLTLDQSFALLRYAKGKSTLDDRYSTMGSVVANLTPYGTEIMEERIQRRSSPVHRSRTARRGLLIWLWRRQDEGVNCPAVTEILDAPESMFEGVRLTEADFDRAGAYLDEKGLIKGMKVDQSRGPAKAEITAKGQDCVENFDGDTGAYDRRHGGTTYNTYLPNAQGVIVGEQQNFTQNNTSGVDATKFVQLAGYIGQISGTLNLADPDRADLEHVARELHDEATAQTPQPGRLRQMASVLKDKLIAAGATMAATVGIQMADQAIAALTQ